MIYPRFPINTILRPDPQFWKNDSLPPTFFHDFSDNSTRHRRGLGLYHRRDVSCHEDLSSSNSLASGAPPLHLSKNATAQGHQHLGQRFKPRPMFFEKIWSGTQPKRACLFLNICFCGKRVSKVLFGGWFFMEIGRNFMEIQMVCRFIIIVTSLFLQEHATDVPILQCHDDVFDKFRHLSKCQQKNTCSP